MVGEMVKVVAMEVRVMVFTNGEGSWDVVNLIGEFNLVILCMVFGFQ